MFSLTHSFPKALGSEPTVWDGDEESTLTHQSPFSGSKPTVWDGDGIKLGEKIEDFFVLSPPCGMEAIT